MRRRLPAVLALAFIVVPILEIYVLIQVGHVIGAWWTVLLLIADSFLGAWLVKREWRGTWRALQQATREGRIPDRELVDAGLVLVGGTLLLTPGFVTDVFGFFFVLPFTRPIARRLVVSYASRRLVAIGPLGAAWVGGRSGPRPATGSRGPVVPGEVVDDDPLPPG